jgi:hypothetical protein
MPANVAAREARFTAPKIYGSLRSHHANGIPWRTASLSPRLVICLLLSALFGAAAAVVAVASGLGWIAGLLAYSFGTSAMVPVLAIAAMPRKPRPVRSPRLPAPQTAG